MTLKVVLYILIVKIIRRVNIYFKMSYYSGFINTLVNVYFTIKVRNKEIRIRKGRDKRLAQHLLQTP